MRANSVKIACVYFGASALLANLARRFFSSASARLPIKVTRAPGACQGFANRLPDAAADAANQRVFFIQRKQFARARCLQFGDGVHSIVSTRDGVKFEADEVEVEVEVKGDVNVDVEVNVNANINVNINIID